MRIYHVHETWRDEWESDLDRGMVKVRRRVLEPSNQIRLTHDGVTYEVQPDGSFDVPEEVGTFYVGPPVARAGWHTGVPPFALNEVPPAMAPRRGRVPV